MEKDTPCSNKTEIAVSILNKVQYMQGKLPG